MSKDEKIHMLREEMTGWAEEGREGASAEVNPVRPDPEVAAKPKRRRFTAEYKLRVLEELDRAGAGQGGVILRREGLYSSHITEWRRARTKGALGALSKKRGRKAKASNPLQQRVARLERELAQTQDALRKAQIIIEVQGKVAGLLGTSPVDGKNS